MKSTLRPAIALAICFCATAPAATIFNFDGDGQRTTTSFADSVNGLSATFSSPASPGSFSVQPSFFQTLTGNVLGGPLFQNNVPLDINFSADQTAITLVFSTADFNTPSPFTITAYEGNTLVGSNSLPGMFLPGFIFPEGEIAFSGAIFNNVVLTTTAPNFAIDNVQVAGTPEPRTAWLLGLGFVALAAPVTRKR